jgi:hypothetical protein
MDMIAVELEIGEERVDGFLTRVDSPEKSHVNEPYESVQQAHHDKPCGWFYLSVRNINVVRLAYCTPLMDGGGCVRVSIWRVICSDSSVTQMRVHCQWKVIGTQLSTSSLNLKFRGGLNKTSLRRVSSASLSAGGCVPKTFRNVHEAEIREKLTVEVKAALKVRQRC